MTRPSDLLLLRQSILTEPDEQRTTKRHKRESRPKGDKFDIIEDFIKGISQSDRIIGLIASNHAITVQAMLVHRKAPANQEIAQLNAICAALAILQRLPRPRASL